MTITTSAKSSKAEIIAAFEEMKQKYEELRQQQPQQPLALRKAEDDLLKKTSTYAPSTLEDAVASLRRAMHGSLDELTQKLQAENSKLTDVRNAVTIATARLAEAHNITLGAEALDVIIASYNAKEKELKAKYDLTEETFTLEMARKKKDWEREQEEYAYNLKIERKKEQDAYETECAKKETAREEKLAKRETEIVGKEAAIAAKEQEVAALEAERKEFPDKLSAAIKSAENQTAENLRKEFAIDKKLAEQEWRAEKNMLEAKIASLVEAAKAQAVEMKSLKDSSAAATQHAQTLAATVIESVSGFKQTVKQTEAPKE